MGCVVNPFPRRNSCPVEAFGASHRVYLDTPPLKGYWRGTLVPRCELDQSSTVSEIGFLTRNRSFGGVMEVHNHGPEGGPPRLRGRLARFRSIGTKLTPVEEKRILAAAEADGKAPSEWARDLLLGGAASAIRGEMEMHIFTELVGLPMLLMSALEPLLRGETKSPHQVASLFRQSSHLLSRSAMSFAVYVRTLTLPRLFSIVATYGR